jgi:hypothetical protein
MRHRQKDSTQTSLLDDVLSIRIERDSEMVTKAAQIREICKHIFEIGTIDEDKLAHVILLHALSSELRYVRDKYEDDATSTPADIVQSLEKAKMRWDEETKKTGEEEERANAAHAVKSSQAAKGSKTGLCSTCSGKHRTDECWGAGGAMEGKREEVLERRAAHRKDKESKADKPSSTKPDGKPRFAMKDASGKTVYFTIADDNADSAATAINEVTPNSELEELYKVYHAHRDSNTSNFSMFADPDMHTALVAASNCEPFTADTGATVHISPVKEDFDTLQPISPQKIRGVSGIYIEAIAKGKIHICSNSGRIFILCDVLYVLQASMRLLSIGRVVDQGYYTLFADDGFSIVDIKSQTTTITVRQRNTKCTSSSYFCAYKHIIKRRRVASVLYKHICIPELC